MTTENYIVSLSLAWTKFETADARLESTIFQPPSDASDHSPYWPFPLCNEKTTKTDIPIETGWEHYATHKVQVKLSPYQVIVGPYHES